MPASFRACIDSPRPSEALYGESISIAGWFYHAESIDSPVCLRAYLDSVCVGKTELRFVRPDVNEHLGIAAGSVTGFRILARLPGELTVPREVLLTVRATLESDEEVAFGEVPIQLIPAHLSHRDHGLVLFPEQQIVLHRENIYGSGPPIDVPGTDCLRLILEYLQPGSSVADIGCGSGAYGPAILQSGRRWLGLEVNPFCLQRLRERNLPHREVRAPTSHEPIVLPGADHEFEDAICIEVLEHIAAPDDFLREIARITRGRFLASVPNMEIVPYFKPWEVVPWHLLEADHKNFFTRASLNALLSRHFKNVEVFSYVPHPLLTRDGIPVHVHLFAVASAARA